QVEVVDEKGADQHGNPAGGIHSLQKELSRRAVDAPDDTSHGLPLPEQQQQRYAGEQHIGAAFNGRWYEPGPRALEPWARHYTVLDGEKSEQGGVDRQGKDEGPVRSGVHRLRNAEISYKADG